MGLLNGFAQLNIDQLQTEAKKGDTQSMVDLGEYYRSIDNYKEAIKWLEKAVKKGSVDAYLPLVYIYLNDGPFKNVKKGFKYLEEGAAKGVPYAQFYLYEFYDGKYLKEFPEFKINKELANEWLNKSFAQNYSLAIIEKLSSIPLEKKPKYLEILINQGFNNYIFTLGLVYYYLKDFDNAAKWLNNPHLEEDKDALFLLGLCYGDISNYSRNSVLENLKVTGFADDNRMEKLNWRGVNPQKSKEYLLKASELGSHDAMVILGLVDLLDYDYIPAKKLIRSAAKEGNSAAVELSQYIDENLDLYWIQEGRAKDIFDNLTAERKQIRDIGIDIIIKDGKSQVIKNNNIIVPFGTYSFIDDKILGNYKNQNFLIKVGNDGLYGAINIQGDLKVPVKFKELEAIDATSLFVYDEDGNKKLFSTIDGSMVQTSDKYDKIGKRYGNIQYVYKGNQFGAINPNTGEEVIPIGKYSKIGKELNNTYSKSGRFISVYDGNKIGVFDCDNNKEIIPPQFDRIDSITLDGNYFVLYNNNPPNHIFYLYSRDGNMISSKPFPLKAYTKANMYRLAELVANWCIQHGVDYAHAQDYMQW